MGHSATEQLDAILASLRRVVLGQDAATRDCVVALLAGARDAFRARLRALLDARRYRGSGGDARRLGGGGGGARSKGASRKRRRSATASTSSAASRRQNSTIPVLS